MSQNTETKPDPKKQQTLAFVVPPVRGEIKRISPANGTDFTLAELYAAIGEECDCVTLHRLDDVGTLMVVDDDGYSKGKLTNIRATLAAMAAGMSLGERGIVGTVVICEQEAIR